MKLLLYVSAFVLNSVLALHYHNIYYIREPQNNLGLFRVESGLTAVANVSLGLLDLEKKSYSFDRFI